MRNKVIDNSAQNNLVVHKSGNETIAGNKNFTGTTTVSGLNITGLTTTTQDIKRTIDLDVTTAPATNRYFVPFQLSNRDDSVKYYEQISYLTTGAIRQTFGLQRTVNGTKIGTSTILEIDANGNKSVLIDMTPATTSNNQQIATTAWVRSQLSSSGNGLATISKSQNGYCKFTNGLIIQWGYTTTGENTAITLPTPFTTTNYSVTLNSVTSDSEQYARLVNNKTTTSFKMNVGGGASSTPYNWIAIGY